MTALKRKLVCQNYNKAFGKNQIVIKKNHFHLQT